MDTVSSQCCFEQFVYSGLWSVGAEALENSSTFFIQTFIFSINKFSTWDAYTFLNIQVIFYTTMFLLRVTSLNCPCYFYNTTNSTPHTVNPINRSSNWF